MIYQDKFESKVECPKCQKSMRKRNLAQHMHKHLNERPRFNCPDCTKVFLHQKSLDNHHQKIHEGILQDDESKAFLCNICGKKWVKLTDLEIHMIAHRETRPYACDQCHMTYKRAYELTGHINKRHLNIRPHTCSYCGLGFFTRRILDNHIRTHTNERPFACEICQQTFRIEAGLFLHKQHHHFIQPKKLQKKLNIGFNSNLIKD